MFYVWSEIVERVVYFMGLRRLDDGFFRLDDDFWR